MNNRELNRQLQSIKDLIKKTRSSCRDIEIQSHWARYLCVLSAGFIENSLVEVYSEFAHKTANEPVANYAISMIKKVQNPNAQKFLETAGSFKKKWLNELEIFISDQGRKEALDSIMANRHLIVHGKNSTITVARVDQYLAKCVEIICFVENQCQK